MTDKPNPLREEDQILADLLGSDHPDFVLPFSWKDLSVEHLGVDAHQSRTKTEQWNTRLVSGREVSLVALYQSHTYGGLLCGLPRYNSLNESPIKSAMELARELFSLGGDRPVVLPPLMQRVTVRNHRSAQMDGEDGYPKTSEVDFLPPVVSIGKFDSSSARDHTQSNSSVVVIWFQNGFGPPEAGHLLYQFANMNWDQVANDWTW